MIIKELFYYLFPPVRRQQKLPLLPLKYSNDQSKAVSPRVRQQITLLKGRGAARTDAQAIRLLQIYENKSVAHIVKMEKRKRRRQPRLALAWKRFWSIFK